MFSFLNRKKEHAGRSFLQADANHHIFKPFFQGRPDCPGSQRTPGRLEGQMFGDVSTEGAVGFLQNNTVYCVAYRGGLEKGGKSVRCDTTPKNEVLVSFGNKQCFSLLTRDGLRRLETYSAGSIEQVLVQQLTEHVLFVLTLKSGPPVVLVVLNATPLAKALRYCGVPESKFFHADTWKPWKTPSPTLSSARREMTPLGHNLPVAAV
eukprot:comp9779_c0_seq1/m.4736 comp9779_c0_seq1/g.4736  ORF comp9779_c0_seq1/g.4736 comp9779_c0_seq1/m.4736 type:complete len:207 (-) comp9779_c0_seq1:357-977(-)